MTSFLNGGLPSVSESQDFKGTNTDVDWFLKTNKARKGTSSIFVL